jgi:hypothetical protein
MTQIYTHRILEKATVISTGSFYTGLLGVSTIIKHSLLIKFVLLKSKYLEV